MRKAEETDGYERSLKTDESKKQINNSQNRMNPFGK
jgi:hypothetical protein